MTAVTLSADVRVEIREGIREELSDLGALMVAAPPNPTALATPTGFGLVKVEKTEAAPIALNALSLQRSVVVTDVSNGTGAAVGAGLSFAVLNGRFYHIDAEFWLGSAAASVGGVVFSLVLTLGATTSEVIASVDGNLGAVNTWQPFPSRVTNQLSTQAMCSFDMSATDGRVRIVGFLVPSHDGTIDIGFKNAVGGQTVIVRRGSKIIVTTH